MFVIASNYGSWEINMVGVVGGLSSAAVCSAPLEEILAEDISARLDMPYNIVRKQFEFFGVFEPDDDYLQMIEENELNVFVDGKVYMYAIEAVEENVTPIVYLVIELKKD